jgi:hypothetical protein
MIKIVAERTHVYVTGKNDNWLTSTTTTLDLARDCDKWLVINVSTWNKKVMLLNITIILKYLIN